MIIRFFDQNIWRASAICIKTMCSSWVIKKLVLINLGVGAKTTANLFDKRQIPLKKVRIALQPLLAFPFFPPTNFKSNLHGCMRNPKEQKKHLALQLQGGLQRRSLKI